MNKSKLMCVLAGLFVSSVTASEQVDVLFYVEPNVYQILDREAVHELIQSQIDVANSLHSKQKTGITYNAVAALDWKDNQVSERLEQGKSFVGSAGNIIYSVRFTESEYAEFFDGIAGVQQYESESYDLFRKYHADNVVFISSSVERDTRTIGYAMQNIGVVVGLSGLESNPYLLAHEWGHNIGLGHVKADQCLTANYLMCAENTGVSNGFTENELATVDGVIAKDAAFFLDHFDPEYYLGWYSLPQPKLANVRFSVLDNPIENSLNETELVLELVNEQGETTVINEDVSLELFTEGRGAILGEHYNDVYQRVTFHAGETVKRIDLGVNHDSTDLSLKVGARYGLYLADSNVVDIVIKANADDNNGGSGGESDGGSGGSMGFISMLMLAGLSLIRNKK